MHAYTTRRTDRWIVSTAQRIESWSWLRYVRKFCRLCKARLILLIRDRSVLGFCLREVALIRNHCFCMQILDIGVVDLKLCVLRRTGSIKDEALSFGLLLVKQMYGPMGWSMYEDCHLLLSQLFIIPLISRLYFRCSYSLQ